MSSPSKKQRTGNAFDLVVKNVTLVRPDESAGLPTVDIGIKDGKFMAIMDAGKVQMDADTVVDGTGMMMFPGLIDAHQHVGIYQHISKDAISESKACAMGGVTTSMVYMRTGQYYLNKSGPYKTFMPELKEICKDKFMVDYTFHIAPIRREHRQEFESLADDHGVTSFKIFMFYGGHGLHGKAVAGSQSDFLMIKDEEGHAYDFAHFEFIMRELKKLSDKRPELGPELSLSLHCEFADILKAYTGLVESEGKLQGLAAYSASRPPHSEGMAIFLASYLADETAFPRINLLHLTSKKAFVAANQMAVIFPHIDFRREVTIGHLLLDCDCMEFPTGSKCFAKVNPPIRPREDVEYLWKMVIEGKVDWVVSDHACCSKEQKVAEGEPDNITKAKSGFGGAEWLLSGLFSEGTKRGLTPNRVAAMLTKAPAERFGLKNKGDVAVGKDADFVLFDPKKVFTVRAADSPSDQGYTPFEGQTLTGKVMQTFLRGNKIFDNGKVIGEPIGKYVGRGPKHC